MLSGLHAAMLSASLPISRICIPEDQEKDGKTDVEDVAIGSSRVKTNLASIGFDCPSCN